MRNWTVGIITFIFMTSLAIIASGQDVPIPDRLKARFEVMAERYERKNYVFFATEVLDRTVISTWLTDKEQVSAQGRIDALRETWDIVQAPNYENFAVYSTQALAGNDELGMYPIGPKTSFSSAEALMSELEANSMITDEFNLQIAHANAFGGILPINHGVVTMYPKDDEGPGFLVDRYLNDGFAIIEEQFTLAYVNPLLQVFTGVMPVDHFKIETIDDPDLLLNTWEEIITPGPSENCLLSDPEGATCSMPKGDGGETIFIVLPGLMSDLESAKAALDSQVFSIEDGHPCGGVSSQAYVLNACSRNMTDCWVPMSDAMGCSDTFDYGINYVSRCVASPDYTNLTVYIIGYMESDTGLTCLDY